MAMLLTAAGDQLPVIPFAEVLGSVGAAAPLQIGGRSEKVGVLLGVTVCVSVAVSEHCPAEGVNV